MTWTFTISIPTPSLNETIRWNRWERAQAARDWFFLVRGAMNAKEPIPLAKGKRRLRITRHGARLLDRDNLYGGAKQLIDELKNQGLIVDDRAELLDLVVEQEVYRKGQPFTAVELEDVA